MDRAGLPENLKRCTGTRPRTCVPARQRTPCPGRANLWVPSPRYARCKTSKKECPFYRSLRQDESQASFCMHVELQPEWNANTLQSASQTALYRNARKGWLIADRQNKCLYLDYSRCTILTLYRMICFITIEKYIWYKMNKQVNKYLY